MSAEAIAASGRPLRRSGTLPAGGVLATLLVHGLLVIVVWRSHGGLDEPLEISRDVVATTLVKLGKPRDKFWLPRITQPPRPKAPPPSLKVAEDPNAAPAPAEAPRPEDAEVSKDLRRALERARALSKAAEEPEEGKVTGSAAGTAAEAAEGDAYAAAVVAAIRRNWSVPAELVPEDELRRLAAEVRIRIAEDGALVGDGRLVKPSGNATYDDTCLAAIKATDKVPPPPEAQRARAGRGFVIVFDGKSVGR